MATLCEYLISKDIDVNCLDPVVKGIEQNAVIMNRNDVDFAATTWDPVRTNVINTLVLKTGKRGYPIYVPSPTAFNKTLTALDKSTNRNTFHNDFGFVILNHDPDVCSKIIDGLSNGAFVVVYENKYKNFHKTLTPGDSAFQVFGWYQFLLAETIQNDRYSADTDGGWEVIMKETGVPNSGIFLYDTSYSVTKTKFNSLTTTV